MNMRLRFKPARLLAPSLAATLLVLTVAGQAQLRIRKNQKDLTVAERQNYVDAMKDLKAAAKAGTSAITDRYDEYVQMHATQCIHGDSGFLPWHRKLLWEFETNVRAMAPKYANFTVPYWDWTQDAFPADLAAGGDNGFMGPTGAGAVHTVAAGPFRAGQWTTLKNGPTNGVKDLERNFTNITDLVTSGAPSAANLLAQTTYNSMAPISETGAGLHNAAHVDVGGQLSNTAGGADDPVFFMLHGYVDYLWARWEVGNGTLSSYVPYNGGLAAGGQLDGFGDAGNTIGFSGTKNNLVSDQLNFLDTTRLGYTYQLNGREIAAPEPSAIAFIGTGLLSMVCFGLKRRRKAA